MKKASIVFLFLMIMILVPSCKSVDNDGGFIYNNAEYIMCPYDDIQYNFIGDNHFVIRVFTGLYRDLYCLDSDFEENVLFEQGLGNCKFWYKKGFEFPNEYTIANSIIINHYEYLDDTVIKTSYDFLSNVSFDEMFCKIIDPDIESQLFNIEISNYTIKLIFGNIERIQQLYIFNEHIYTSKTIYEFTDNESKTITFWYLLNEQFKNSFFELVS